LLDLVVHLVVGNTDAGAVEAAHDPVPGDFSAHLLFKAGGIDSRCEQVGISGLSAGESGLGSHAFDGAVDLFLADFQFELGGFVELQVFINQLFKCLTGDLLNLFLGRLLASKAEEQHASPVANIGERDWLIIDDRGNAFQRQAAIAWGSVLRTCFPAMGRARNTAAATSLRTIRGLQFVPAG
jgi:hypothetical protein